MCWPRIRYSRTSVGLDKKTKQTTTELQMMIPACPLSGLDAMLVDHTHEK
jgi:hypothetical protein